MKAKRVVAYTYQLGSGNIYADKTCLVGEIGNFEFNQFHDAVVIIIYPGVNTLASGNFNKVVLHIGFKSGAQLVAARESPKPFAYSI